mmetsp:Transcript_35719/g.77731  ORF Transcript_35719/g.77731 Transcript_35719/m.77731 type:complete len:263 (-) Transcript_35719:214-1002(-)
MPRVVKALEPDQIRREEGPQELLALGEGAEDLRGGEGRVQEHADFHLVRALPKQRRQHQQMVVMHPDEVLLRPQELHQLVDEQPVPFHVGRPVVLLESPRRGRRQRQQVVQQRPQRLLAKVVVVLLLQLFPEKDGHVVEPFLQLGRDGVLVVWVDLLGEAAHVDDLEVPLDLARARLHQQRVLVDLEVPPARLAGVAARRLLLRHRQRQFHLHHHHARLPPLRPIPLRVRARQAQLRLELGPQLRRLLAAVEQRLQVTEGPS